MVIMEKLNKNVKQLQMQELVISCYCCDTQNVIKIVNNKQQ